MLLSQCRITLITPVFQMVGGSFTQTAFSKELPLRATDARVSISSNTTLFTPSIQREGTAQHYRLSNGTTQDQKKHKIFLFFFITE